jgi:hypothetical protein
MSACASAASPGDDQTYKKRVQRAAASKCGSTSFTQGGTTQTIPNQGIFEYTCRTVLRMRKGRVEEQEEECRDPVFVQCA